MSDEDFDLGDCVDLEPEPSDPNQLWGGSHARIARKLYRRGDYKRAFDKDKAVEAT